MHFRGHSKHIALRVCFIQKLIQDGILNVKQCPNAVQTADIRQRLCLAYLLNFTDHLLGDKHVGDKWFIIRPFLSHVCWPSSFSFGLRRYAALSTCPCLALRLHTCSLSVLVTYEQGGGMRIAMALRLSVVSLLSTHALRSYILRTMMLWVRGGVRVRP